MSEVEVVGLSADGMRVVLRIGADRLDAETVEVPLEDIRRAERRAASTLRAMPDLDEPLTPRLVQQRIRCGETAEEVAAGGGWPVEAVRRYEGPPLAERRHHAELAQASETDGRLVGELVEAFLGSDDVAWDSWLVEDGRWEVQASAAGQALRLRWDPLSRRVLAIDEPARRALRVAGLHDDVLTAVLRPVATTAAPPATPRSRSGRRAEIPDWDDINRQVTGREPDLP